MLDALTSLGISEDLVRDLHAFLTASAGELKDSTPDPVVTGAFGSSPASAQCAGDAQKARTHVADALTDMGAALKGYGGVVTGLLHEVSSVDDAAHADLTRKAAAANACVAPSFAAPSQCTLPGNSSGSD